MSTIEAMKKMAEKATPSPLKLSRYDHGGGRLYHEDSRTLVMDTFNEWDREFYAALTPETVLRLLAVACAAQAINDGLLDMGSNYQVDAVLAEQLDDALAKLEGM
jgi:uncharacterized protein